MLSLEENFAPPENEPAVPETLLERTITNLQNCQRVDVDRRQGANSWKKINGFELQLGADQYPSASPEVISQTIVSIAQHDVEDRGEGATTGVRGL
jgi:hypothetical protein